MIRIAALHSDDDSSDDNLQSPPIQRRPATKEAQESQAFSLYNKGLSLQRQGDPLGAEQVFRKILHLDVVEEAEPITNEDEGVVTPIHQLKYSTHKNLAGLAAQNGDNKEAMQNYIQAVILDSTDVTVWYKMGLLALKLDHYPLARHSFEQGLECNTKHWPCLNQIITVLYALGCYEACLVYISRALQRDPGYMKGLAFLNIILKEQKCLQINTETVFKDCDQEIFSTKLEDDEASEFIDEALEMRKRKQELNKPQPKPFIQSSKPMQAYTWKCLGDCLVKVYDAVKKAERPVSLACRVNLSSLKPIPQPVEKTTLGAPAAVPDEVLLEDTCTSKTADETIDSDTGMEVDDSEVKKDNEENVPEIPDATTDTTPANGGDAPPSEDVTMETSTLDLTAADMSLASETDANTTFDEKKKKSKKKRLPSCFEDLAEKRRSSRVRNVVKKPQEEVVNYQEVLLKILPHTLLHVQEGEDSENSQDAEEVAPQSEQASQAEPVDPFPADSASITETEEADVKWFMERFRVNSGIIELLNEYLIALANRGEKIWPEGVTEVYLKAYRRLRKHIIYPNFLCKDEPDERINDMGLMCLVYSELKLDHWLKTRSKISPSKRSPSNFGSDFQSDCFEDDMWYITSLSTCREILDDGWLDFCVRVYWMKARYLVLKNNKDDAADCFERTREFLKQEEDKSIHLHHCKHDNYIAIKELEKQIETLRRCQSLEELQRLYDEKEYEKVVDLLLQTFAAKSKMFQANTQERHTQLHLLQKSLLQLDDFKRCLLWSEVSLNEALMRYQNAGNNEVKEDWFATLKLLFDGLNTCLSKENTVVKSMPSKNVVRLTQNLIRLIEMAMDASDSASHLAIDTVMPWILLYKLMHHEEQKTSSNPDLDVSADASDKELRPSLMLLNVTHEYLGRTGWCVSCDGALLLFTAEVMTKELHGYAYNEEDESHPFKDELTQIIEQCYYCLYGHPTKKTKAKHLQDHGVSQVELTWGRSAALFDHFKPQNLPEFDSIKTNTVSSELEILLRRIIGLIPSQPGSALSVDSITEYIDGTTNTAPTLPTGLEIDMPIVTEIYYLLADYHFKNKEQVKAIKYYLLDISMTPERFDSWAGIALAKLSKLEQKMNSHEYRSDGKSEGFLWKNAVSALRCFKRALEMDCTNSKLWIEYGSLAYQLHSFASRQLKQEPMFPLAEDVRKLSLTKKTEMLKIAHNCYVKASECETEESEEEWLHHYMLGKIAEKMGRPPKESLEHYKQAANHLYEDCAKYPRKITYIYSPPQLACEALEVFYRLHVCAVKSTIKRSMELPLELIKTYLEESLESPFAKCKEKKLKSGKENEKKTKQVGADHPYSKRKSKDENGERSDQENDSSADEAPSSKKMKIVTRLVTNQRTGVPVAGSSASDDSCQSQPAKTPPHAFSSPAITTSLASNKLITTEAHCSGSLNLASEIKDGNQAIGERSEAVEESSWDASVEIIDSILEEIVQSSEQEKKDMSIEIIDDIIRQVVNQVEEKRQKEKETTDTEQSENDVSIIEISDSDLDDSFKKPELKDEEKEKENNIDEPKLRETSSDVMEVETDESCEKNEESENLAKALLQELKQLSGDTETLDSSISSIVEQDFGDKVYDVKEEPVTVKSEKEQNMDEQIRDKVDVLTKEVSVKREDALEEHPQSITVKDEEMIKVDHLEPEVAIKEEKESREEEKTGGRDQPSPDLAADALERLTSELMFLNESLCGSTSDSAADTSNVMEWVEAEEKKEKDDMMNTDLKIKEEKIESTDQMREDSDDKVAQSIDALKKDMEKRGEGSDVKQQGGAAETSSEGVKPVSIDISETPSKERNSESTAKELGKLKSPALAAIGMEYASSLASETDAEDRSNLSSTARSNLERVKETNVEDHKVKDSRDTSHQTGEGSNKNKQPTDVEMDESKPNVVDVETGENEEKEAKTGDVEKVVAVVKEEVVSSTLSMKAADETQEKQIEDKDEAMETECSNEKEATSTLAKVEQKDVVGLCLKGLKLCLKRFPQHFKSLYRMAFIYYHSKDHRNLKFCRDLLMGNPQWQQLDHMPCPGLFQERKATNFFQGLWRIPIEEFDRAGSFPWHLMRSLLLLFDVLRDLKDCKTFFFIYQQLNKSPDAGKKYLRDTDRQELAKLAWRYTMEAVEANLPEIHNESDAEIRMEFLMSAHKIWNYGKIAFKPQAVNGMLSRAYRAFRQGKIDPDPSPLEQAMRFCQLHLSVKSTPGSASPAVSLQKPLFPTYAASSAASPATSTLQKEESLRLGDPSKYTTDVQSKLPRLQSDEADKLHFQPAGQSSPKKLKSLSPSRAPVEKTNLGQKELNELLERELSRKKDVAKKIKSPGKIERKTMKQLKALANPILGAAAVETAMKPTMTSKPLQKVPPKSKEIPTDKPKIPSKSIEKHLGKPSVTEAQKERVDSPSVDGTAEDALVQESMIQAMLQQHAAAITASTSLESYSPYASIHPMWSMYSPTFMGSAVSGLPIMDASKSSAVGYYPGNASTPKPVTSGGKKPSGNQQAKRISQQTASTTEKKATAASVNVKKSTTVKRPHSATISLPSVVLPRLSLSDFPAAKKFVSESKAEKAPSKKNLPGPKIPIGQPQPMKKPSQSGPPQYVKNTISSRPSPPPITPGVSSSSQGLPKQKFHRDITQYEKATTASGLPCLKPISLQRAAPKPVPKSSTAGKQGNTASQPRKVTVYPVAMHSSAFVQKQPPPAHGGLSAAARKPGPTGLDFSRAKSVPKPHAPRPPSDDDVIVLDDSD